MRHPARHLGLVLPLAGIVFALDLHEPLGVAVPVLYLPIIGLALAAGMDWAGFHLGLGTTVLTWLGWLLSPPGGAAWIGLANRTAASLAIWALLLGSLHRRREGRRLQDARDYLQTQIDRRVLDLRREQEDLDALIEGVPQAVAMIDQYGRIVRLNAEMTRLFGYEPDEALGRSIDELLAPPDLRSKSVRLTSRLAGGERIEGEVVRRHRSGRLLTVSLRGVPICGCPNDQRAYLIFGELELAARIRPAT